MTGFGWLTIFRLGLVQASIGAMVMVSTSLLNRVMVVEYALAAAIPAGLVAWHYVVQLSRPVWGHGSDTGTLRTPWILIGMAILGMGVLLAVNATVVIAPWPIIGRIMAVVAFTFIGIGVGAAGTSMLALLASGVAPERRPAAAAVTWIMMVAGIVVSAGIAGSLLDPFSPQRLVSVAGGVALFAWGLAFIAMYNLEKPGAVFHDVRQRAPAPDLKTALHEIRSEPAARRFTVFIFVSMLAYSMQDLILEPFAGLVFGMTPGESTSLAGMQHGGVLVGMILAGAGGSALAGRLPTDLKVWIAAGCVGSGLALAGLAVGAMVGPGWPLTINVFVLGFFNGLFAVAAIGAMMGLAGAGENTREGVRMGVWGASQAIAFGLGGLLGALGVDAARSTYGQDGTAFQIIFGVEAVLFFVAALLAIRAAAPAADSLRTSANLSRVGAES